MTDANLQVAQLTHRMVEDAIAAPRPLIYPFVRNYLADRPYTLVYAQEIVDASDGYFTLAGVGAVMGDLHDHGLVTTSGVSGTAGRRAVWDIG